MNIVRKLTFRHLKENKGRTVVTTLGICVSVAMITAVFVAVASFMNFFAETTIITVGDYHARFGGLSQQTLGEIKNDENIAEVALHKYNDTSYLLSDKKSEAAGIGEIMIGDETYIRQMLTGNYEGEIPKNENEIAIEQSVLEKNGLNLGIGDKIKFAEGERCVYENGERMTVYGLSYVANEVFESKQPEKEYTITMLLHDNPATRFTPIFRGMSETEKSEDRMAVSIKLNAVNYKSLNVLNDIVEKYDIESYNFNTEYLETKFAIDENSFLAKSIIPMAIAVLIIIMIASVTLIYNAFGMSFSERVRYLGMLASVGATKRQKKGSVYFEGLVLGAVGIPVGIAAGIIGIGITLDVVGEKIVSTGMIMGVSDSGMGMDTVVPLWAVVGVVIMSAFTIFISSFIPSRKASKITPIDAIRQNSEIKIKAKNLKTPKIVRAIFGYEGELAHKSLKRNGRKSRVITASIAMSIILFLSCNYFCDMLTQANTMESNIPYQITASVSYNEKDKFIEELKNIDDIDSIYCANNLSFKCGKDTMDINKDFENADYLAAGYKDIFDSTQYLYINVIDDNEFNRLCDNNDIDYRDYYGDTLKSVMLNNVNHKQSGGKVFTDKLLGQKVYSNYEGVPENEKFEISAFVDYDDDNFVCQLSPKNTIAMYVPLSQYINVYSADTDKNEINITLGIETENHKEVAEEIGEILENGDYTNYPYYQDLVDMLQSMNTIVFVLEVFIYGFIVLISLITVANIINTISTNIQLRRKEFAMLKSVGTTPQGFRKMICLESAFYGLKAVIAAIPLSAVIGFALNRMLADSMIPFTINIPMYVVTIAVVFLIIGVTMLYAVSKLKNDSIIETLKEEIN